MSLWRKGEGHSIPAPLSKHKIQRYNSMGVILLKFVLSVCTSVRVCPHVCVHVCIHVHHAQVWGLTMGRHVEVRGGFGLSLPPELTVF